MRLDLDGVWLTYDEPLDFVSSLLPPELRLTGKGRSTGTYPVVVLFNNLKMNHVGPVPVGLLTAPYGEIIVIVPSVEFGATSKCPTYEREQFNYVVATYVGNKVSAELARLTSSRNAYDAKVSSEADSDQFSGQAATGGPTLLQLDVQHPASSDNRTPPALFDVTWNNPSIAPGSIKKFARYAATLDPTYYQPANGSLRTEDGLEGLRAKTLRFGEGDALAARMKGTLRMDDMHQCD